MKKIKLIAIVAAIMVALVSCGKKEAEESKMIPSNAVKKSGKHSNLLSVDADSVRIMLVKVDEEEWQVRAILPLHNEYLWESVQETCSEEDCKYAPKMYNIRAVLLDVNGNHLYSLELDDIMLASVLSSNEYKTEDFLLYMNYRSDRDPRYKANKELFDKVVGIYITGMDLGLDRPSSSSNSVGNDSDNESAVVEPAVVEPAVVEPVVVNTPTPNNAKADALLNKLEGMINRLAKMDDESSAYDVLEDQILDLMDKIDDLDMSNAQEKRYDKLESKFDNI